jgi:hypothetical protein
MIFVSKILAAIYAPNADPLSLASAMKNKTIPIRKGFPDGPIWTVKTTYLYAATGKQYSS